MDDFRWYDNDSVADAREAIRTRFPGSDWAMRADCLDVEIAPGGFSMADPESVRLAQPV